MSRHPLIDLSLVELSRKLAALEVSSREATAAALERIQATDGAIGAFLKVLPEAALAAADAADARAARGARLSPLDGVPVGLKDIFLTEGVETTCGSRILEGFIPPYDDEPKMQAKDYYPNSSPM